jgi:predicted dehydrogenase
MNGKIGVGIVGTGGWAKYGHIASLQTLNEFEVVAICSRTQTTADAVGGNTVFPTRSATSRPLLITSMLSLSWSLPPRWTTRG